MSATHLPVIGACLTVGAAEQLQTWLFDKDRDLEIQDFVFPETLESGGHDIVDRYAGLLDGFRGRIGIHGPFFGLDLAAIDPDIQAVVRKRLLQGLDACEALGATQMVVHSPFTVWHHLNFGNSPQMKQRIVETFQDNLAPVVSRAEDIGCTLVIENIEEADPLERVRLADAFGSDRVRVSIDTGHANCAHGSFGAPPVDQFVKAAGGRLEHVHLQDTDGQADCHWLPGNGTVNWPAFFEALRDHCDQPRLVIEVLGQYQAEIPACVARLEAQGLAQ